MIYYKDQLRIKKMDQTVGGKRFEYDFNTLEQKEAFQEKLHKQYIKEYGETKNPEMEWCPLAMQYDERLKYGYMLGEVAHFSASANGSDQIFFCSCMKESARKYYFHVIKMKRLGVNRDLPPHFKLEFKTNICHLCNDLIPTLGYQKGETKYDKYIHLLEYQFGFGEMERGYGGDLRKIRFEAKQYIRSRGGLKTQWVTEEYIYDLVREILPKRYNVIHNDRPKELQGLQIDVYVPSIKFGIEYNGKQHYSAIEIFGGDWALEKIKKNDRKKRRLAKKAGIKIHTIKYTEKEKVNKEYMEKIINQSLFNKKKDLK